MTAPLWKDLDRERWSRLEALLDSVLELPAAEVGPFLDRVCGGDPRARATIEALLRADRDAAGFLETPVITGGWEKWFDEEEEAGGGHRIGPWRVVREIGRGGMGAVYLAERADGDFEQRVALKRIKRGLDTDEVARRFVRERRILARLEHRHIARLVDGGVTDDGQPWFAMEYVEGKPITEWCEERRSDLDERLRLFRAVSEAVQHAHRAFVVHLDLKPSNIYVTKEGEVKLLDFGIARLLDAKSVEGEAAATSLPRHLLTPQYAAPEQIRGEEATAATDVYGLGIVLYELLAGARPFDRAGLSLEALRERSGEEEPPPPSALRPAWASRLRGDLDQITLMALRSDPGRRYPSVEALLLDFDRYAEGMPVAARPPDAGYRLRKFYRRHRSAVLVTGLLTTVFAVGLAVTMWKTLAVAAVLAVLLAALAVSARQTRAARREARKAAEVRGFLMRVFEVSDPSVSRGQSVTARELLDRGARRIEADLVDQPALRAELLGVLGDLYLKLGLAEPALPLVEREIDLWSTLPRARSGLRGGAFRRRGNLRLLLGDWAAAEADFRSAIDVHRAAPGESSAEMAEDLDQLASALRPQAKLEEAERHVRRSLEIRRSLFGESHVELAVSWNNLALMEREAGRLEEAEQHYRESLRIRRKTLGGDHPDIASTLNNLAILLRQRGRFGEAAEAVREALRVQTRLYGEESAITVASEATLGALLQNLGRFAEAAERQRRVLAYWDAHGGRDHPNAIASLNNLAAVLRDQGELAEAEALQRETVERWRKLVGESHPYYAYGLLNLAACLRDRGLIEEAGALLAQAEAIRRAMHGDEHPEVATVMYQQALLAERAGERSEAERLLRVVLAQRIGHLGAENPATAQARIRLSAVLRQRGELAAAKREAAAALEALVRSLPPEHPDVIAARRELDLAPDQPPST